MDWLPLILGAPFLSLGRRLRAAAPQLFGAADHLLLTDKFIFAVDQDPQGLARLSVVSNLVAGTSATPLLFVKQRRDSIMQEFRLPAGETVVSLQRAYPVRSVPSTTASARERGCPIQRPTPFPLIRSSGFRIHSRMMQEKYRADPNTDAPLEGCILITNRAVYELRPNVSAETVFFSLLAQSKDKTAAEALGKTVGLDLYLLYEAAADQVGRRSARPAIKRRDQRSNAGTGVLTGWDGAVCANLTALPRRSPGACARAVPALQRAHLQAHRPLPPDQQAAGRPEPPAGHPEPARRRPRQVGKRGGEGGREGMKRGGGEEREGEGV